jgi:oligoribonuclease (3'-5' exoribonuclease)
MTTEIPTIRLIWLDLETTGLDPSTDDIVEAAWTTSDLAATDLEPYTECMAHDAGSLWENRHPKVIELHTQSGLIEDTRRRGTALGQVLDGLNAHLDHIRTAQPGTQLILAGNSPHGVDRPFIDRHRPDIGKKLHYRHLDVSALRMLAGSFDSTWLVPADEKHHRALGDIQDSIAFYRTLRAWFRANMPVREGLFALEG